ncbi:phosphonate C-P lyase system protein PhnG [Malaciobacter mytili]|uniref:Alpha-D-ribose 1-methylphosphonate 5-triphosphate synthase n=1 Tax=Malaciobacter mytili LMG 24559 TaxID=1032238 RepID=A0AAX2ACD2_9BACT|nr:phosphonate C-P lyase system protein PhnG [Malaciobacter mytili]AXH14970.1 carbon-phosphorus lyase core complex subunit PhnG [Malaciobacter mytili LMG 24559]RXK12400.1 hypothetical protein CP985_14300 [Malaciobacter mytili LMG 24559]
MKREDINYFAQKATFEEVEKLYKKIDTNYNIKQLTAPTQQTLLVPVIDPVSNKQFYSGEVLVTSTIVQLEDEKGWSMVMDDYSQLSLYIAVLDAAFAKNIYKDEIEKLINNTKISLENQQKILNKKVNSTKVSFDLL